MTQSVLGRLRRFWLDVHLWIGVGLFVVMVPLGVSGAFLVWHDQIDEIIHPQRFDVSKGGATAAASVYLDAARKAFGDRAAVTQIRLPAEPGRPVVASGRIAGQTLAPGQRPQSLTVWIDPATGRSGSIHLKGDLEGDRLRERIDAERPGERERGGLRPPLLERRVEQRAEVAGQPRVRQERHDLLAKPVEIG